MSEGKKMEPAIKRKITNLKSKNIAVYRKVVALLFHPLFGEKKFFLLQFMLVTSSILFLCSGSDRELHAEEAKISESVDIVDDRYYMDFFTFKRFLYTKDPFIWIYTKNFAKRFHMPEAWVDDSLENVMAVAWRMTGVKEIQCGFANKPNNCMTNPTCQMDMYFDNEKHKLPWREDAQSGFMWKGLLSTDFLKPERPDSWNEQYSNFSPRDGKKSEIAIFVSKPHKLVQFDRNFAPGITFISLSDACTGNYNTIMSYKYPVGFESAERHNREYAADIKLDPDMTDMDYVIQIPERFTEKMQKIKIEVENQNPNPVVEDFLRMYFKK